MMELPNKRHGPLRFHRDGVRIVDHQGRDLIKSAAQGAYSVCNVARAFKVTVRQLEYAVEQDIGVKPKELFRQERALMARKLISEGNELETVSRLLGFRSYTHFATEIRKIFGMSPRKVKETLENLRTRCRQTEAQSKG